MSTEQRASATEDLRPVTHEENEEVDGHAIACKRVYCAHLEKVANVRQQQEAYVKSLASDCEIHVAKLAIAIETRFTTSDRANGVRHIWRELQQEGLAYVLRRLQSLLRTHALRARLTHPG